MNVIMDLCIVPIGVGVSVSNPPGDKCFVGIGNYILSKAFPTFLFIIPLKGVLKRVTV